MNLFVHKYKHETLIQQDFQLEFWKNKRAKNYQSRKAHFSLWYQSQVVEIKLKINQRLK